MKLKFIAQRKFAQGALASAVQTNNNTIERRVDTPVREKVIIQNNMTATNLLDLVSFQGMHNHLQPVVRLERIPVSNPVKDTPVQHALTSPQKMENEKVLNCRKMQLRSRSKEINSGEKQISKKKTKKNKLQSTKGKMALRNRILTTPSDLFTVEDNRPLKYFVNGIQTRSQTNKLKSQLNKKRSKSDKKVPTAVGDSRDMSPEPEPMTLTEKVSESYEIEDGLQSTSNNKKGDKHPQVSPKKHTPNKIHKVATAVKTRSNIPTQVEETQQKDLVSVTPNSIEDESEESHVFAKPQSLDITTPDLRPASACSSVRFSTAKEVMQADKQDLAKGCNHCSSCERIRKVVSLKDLVKKSKQSAQNGVGEDEDDNNSDNITLRLSPDNVDNTILYLDILPQSNNQIIEISQSSDNGRMLSARLVPRSEANALEDFNLIENENLLDDLLKSLNVDRPSKGKASLQMQSSNDKSKTKGKPELNKTRFPKRIDSAKMVDAPVYNPTEAEFKDPIAFYDKIESVAVKYGVCKVVPPPGFTPSCILTDNVRFSVVNQYIPRMYNRWGPATRELCAIKKSFATQFKSNPLHNGLEVNLPKLFQLVQRFGGLEKVIEKNYWTRIAEEMGFPKTPNIDKKIDQLYVKYVLPYDTLSNLERQQMMTAVEQGWQKKNKKVLERARNPLHRQKRLLGESDSSEDDTEEETDIISALTNAEDCLVKGRNMSAGNFVKVAATAIQMFFPQGSPTTEQVENLYWRYVLTGDEHICVYSASLYTGDEGHGFPNKPDDPYTEHPWNLKNLRTNSGNVLSSVGPLLGVTVPTLHFGMIFSTSCWHRDPHGLPWVEYMHKGPNKIWYGIPDEQSGNFRKAVETLCPASCQNKEYVWLPSDITMIPPKLLLDHGVSLSRVEQKPGEFIIVFPRAYSSSISTGYTVSESAYFATHSWLNTVHGVFGELRESCEPTMFPLEQLLIAVGKDPLTPRFVLARVLSSLRTIFQEEFQNRQTIDTLQEGRPSRLRAKPNTRKRFKGQTDSNNETPRDESTNECEICRMMLYLSKVTGVTGRSTSVCLRHATRLLQLNQSAGFEMVTKIPSDQLTQILEHIETRLLSS